MNLLLIHFNPKTKTRFSNKERVFCFTIKNLPFYIFEYMGRLRKRPERKVCEGCGSKHSTTYSELCLGCRRSTYNYSSDKNRKHKLKKILKKVPTIIGWKQDIKVLTWKKKIGDLTPIDCYIVCSIYMDVFNAPDSYAGQPVKKQVVYMLNELNTILAEKLKTYNK